MTGTLELGDLGFSQFTWSTNAGFGNGEYTLFDLGGIGSVNGALSLTDTNGIIVTGYTGTLWLDENNGNVMLTVIPEPSALTLVGMGLVGAMLLRRLGRHRS